MKINSEAIIGAIQQLNDDEVLQCQKSGDEITLSAVKKSAVTFGRKIQAFFGFGPHQLREITDLFSRVVTNPILATTIPSDAVAKLNRRIDHYNKSGLRKYFSCLQIKALEVAVAQKVVDPTPVVTPQHQFVVSEEFAEVQRKLAPFAEPGAKRHRANACKEAFDALLRCLRAMPDDQKLYKGVSEALFDKGSSNILHLASQVQRDDVVNEILDIEGLSSLLLKKLDAPTPLDLACDRNAVGGEINLNVLMAFFERLNFDLLDQLLEASRPDMLHNLLQQSWSLHQSSQQRYTHDLPAYKELFEQVFALENIELQRKFLFCINTSKNSVIASACLLSGQRWVVELVAEAASEELLLEALQLSIHVGNDEYPILDYIYGVDDAASQALLKRISESVELQEKMADANLALPKDLLLN